jgi:ABC-type sugar transport system ATPase subunit
MLRLTNIDKRFSNGTLAFEGINLEIAPQTIVRIVGPSGSGKSTLLRVISGLRLPRDNYRGVDKRRNDRSARSALFSRSLG